MSAHVDRYCPFCGEAIPTEFPLRRYWPPDCAQKARDRAQGDRRKSGARPGGLHPTGSAKIRLCLRCDAPFPSTWEGHRFCALCRGQQITVDTGMMRGASVALRGHWREAP